MGTLVVKSSNGEVAVPGTTAAESAIGEMREEDVNGKADVAVSAMKRTSQRGQMQQSVCSELGMRFLRWQPLHWKTRRLVSPSLHLLPCSTPSLAMEGGYSYNLSRLKVTQLTTYAFEEHASLLRNYVSSIWKWEVFCHLSVPSSYEGSSAAVALPGMLRHKNTCDPGAQKVLSTQTTKLNPY